MMEREKEGEEEQHWGERKSENERKFKKHADRQREHWREREKL